MAKFAVLVVFILGLSAQAFNDSDPKQVVMDPVTVKDTELAFQEALKEELPGLQDVKLLATHPQRLSANPPGLATKGGEAVASISPSSGDDVSEFEKDVTDLVLG